MSVHMASNEAFQHLIRLITFFSSTYGEVGVRCFESNLLKFPAQSSSLVPSPFIRSQIFARTAAVVKCLFRNDDGVAEIILCLSFQKKADHSFVFRVEDTHQPPVKSC